MDNLRLIDPELSFCNRLGSSFKPTTFLQSLRRCFGSVIKIIAKGWTLNLVQVTYLGGIDEGVLEDDGGHLATACTVALVTELLDQAANELGLKGKKKEVRSCQVFDKYLHSSSLQFKRN